MHFKQLNKTTWRCVADGPPNPITGERKQISRRGKSKSHAKERVEQAIEALKSAYNFDSKVKFNNFGIGWMELYRLRGNKDNTNEYREHCIGLLNRYFANKRVTAITTLDIQGAINDLFEQETSQNTLRGVLNVAKMMFTYAKEIGLTSINPVEAVFVPKQKIKLEEVTGEEVSKLYLETNELKVFLSFVDQYRNIMYRTLIYLITFTGMRPGEAIALKTDDIDLDKKIIRITKTVYAKANRKGDFELTPPKTNSSVRVIDLDDIIVEMISELYRYREEREWIISEFVFGDKDGVPPTVKLLNQTVRRIGNKTSIKKQFRTYILRHTHISLLAEAGVDLNYIMNRVGHKNSNTTTQIYLHVTSGMRENASQKMHTKFTQLLSD
ncbi:tyrosine-type recombinase/integrase [Psychrobacillus sp. NPDC096426]|uniref:tyrosine-type recombinase/integrase n=1 Tax=Psychrobacillus sp. NPDC096426 TaxID=3364491 RepID=UPI0037F67824